MALSPPTQTTTSRAIRLLAGQTADAQLVQLNAADQQLVLEYFQSFMQLADQLKEFEFTLRKLLDLLCETLHLHVAGFVDYEDATCYAVVRGTPGEHLAEELHTEAQLMAHEARAGKLHNTVLWNRRNLSRETQSEGDWYVLVNKEQSLVPGGFMFHAPAGFQVAEPTLIAILLRAAMWLALPLMQRQNQKLANRSAARYRAVSEMVTLFNAEDNRDFCLQYLLVLLEHCGVDRGILWELDAAGNLVEVYPIGVPVALARDLSVDGAQPLWQQLRNSRETIYIPEPLLLLVTPSARTPVGGPALQTQVCERLLAFPLEGSERITGVVLLLDANLQELGGQQFAGMMGRIPGSFLENADRQQQLLNSKELEMQVGVARDIQRALQPSEVPPLPGYEIRAISRSAKAVGGDFYHLYRTPTQFVATVGDVSGKGVPAGMLMMTSRSLFHAYCLLDFDAKSTMQKVNQQLTTETPSDRFVSAFHISINPERNVLECWNGGHDPMIVRRADGTIETINADGMLLGVMEDTEFSPTECVLHPGDVALVFTDGMPESMNADREMFGFKRMHAILHATAGQSVDQILEAFLKAQAEFCEGEPQHDDTTMLLIRKLPVESNPTKESAAE